MKLLSKLTRALCSSVVMAAIALPAAVSCSELNDLKNQFGELEDKYEDLNGKVDLIVDKLFELEEKLNNEIQALKDMLDGKVLISSVSTAADTGITTVKLTNGTTLTLYPQADMKSYITYVEASVNGKMVPCWAYIDENGNKKLFKDENGHPIPVETDTPEVVTDGDDIYLVIGGVQYPISGNSVFSNYELVVDELTGEVYAVTFTFGEDMTFTVTVDGACGFHFVMATGWSSVVIDNYFVAPGVTERVQVDARGVVDYVLQIPDGWRVKEYKDVYMGETYFDITAPSDELIASGVAAADGDLKVVAVLEGGKATVSKLYLSTEPFKQFGVSLGYADVKIYNGLQKYVYGVCPKADYDESAIFGLAEDMLTAYDYPKGYGIYDGDMESLPLSEIYGEELVPGEEYVFWTIPALYYVNGDDAGFYLKEGSFKHVEFNYVSVLFEVGNETFRDAHLDMELKGVNAYYTELVPASEFYLEDVVYCISNGFYDKVTEPMTFDGSVFTFAGVQAEPATDYVIWIAVAEDGKTYSAADVIVREFSTQTLTAGGSVEVVAGEKKVSALDVKTTLTAAGAETIYYTFLTEANAKKYTDEASRASYLFEKGLFAKSASVEVSVSDVLTSIKPETTYVLMAVAADAEGMYGKVLYETCATGKIEYNNLNVVIEMVQNEPNDVQVSIAAEGGNAAGYIYWIGKTSDNTWKSSNYLGGSAETAQVYMFLNPTNNRLTSIADKYPVNDGIITMTDLAYETEYVVVAVAKDAEGGCSKATAYMFKPRAVSLGNIVYANDSKWEAARPTVKFNAEKFEPSMGMMSGQYSCDVTVPAGFTAYVLLATDNEICMSDVVYDMPAEDKMIRVMQDSNRKRDSDTPDPSIPEDEYINLMWPDGNIFYHHEHGHPLFGYAVIWANREYHESACGCGMEGVTQRNMANGIVIDVNNVILYNDGTPVEFRQPQAIGSIEEVIDKVYIVLQDLDGNCYETYVYDVPVEHFINAQGK